MTLSAAEVAQAEPRGNEIPERARERERLREERISEMTNIGEVTDGEFQATVLDSTTPVLVDFWAEWCVPCHMVSPVVQEIGQERGEVLKVAKLNIDDNPEATRTYGVMSIPSLILFKQGKEVARVVGAKPKDAIMRDLDQHLT
jgi:thioredoxin